MNSHTFIHSLLQACAFSTPISPTPGSALPERPPKSHCPNPTRACPCLASLTFAVREQQLVLPARMGQGGLRRCPGEGTVPWAALRLQLGVLRVWALGRPCTTEHLPTFPVTCPRLCPSGILAILAWPLSEGSRDRVLVGTHPAKSSPTVPGWPQGKGHTKDLDMGSPSPEPKPGSIRTHRSRSESR